MDTIIVYYTKLEDTYTDDVYSAYLLGLPAFLQDKITRIKSKKVQYAKLFGLLLLQNALEQNRFPANLLSKLQYNENGKPFLNPAFEFNISHSAKLVVCVISLKPIGVDVEKIRKVNLQNFTPYFTNQEFNRINNAHNSDLPFFEIWTQKEAFVKAIGLGMTFPFSQIAIKNNEIEYHGERWYVQPLNIDEEYSVHICTNQSSPKVDVKKICFNG